jgi:DDE superfamily endonuclease
MMCFIIIVCKGDIDMMINTATQLTFFEEWLLYFTMVWGRTCTRWYLIAERYCISETTARLIFDVKQQMLLNIREDWPMYTNFDEDIALQREGKWSEFFDNTRVVMWDMTDIAIHQPSCAEPSRLTFSSYYGGCCGKGGIFLQSSSWIGTHDLWMGAVSDSEYLTRSNILENQMMFVRDDHIFKDIVFTNITDKGFRVTADCFRAGGQKILQPPFMKSDKRFTTEQVLEAAAIATIRSANERAVSRIKECEYVKKGLREGENVERVCAVFLTFGFQVNFMFYPVQ